MDCPKYKRVYKSKITTKSHQYNINKIFRSTELIGNTIIHPNWNAYNDWLHNVFYLSLEHNIFNEILDNNNLTQDEIYAFVNIGAYQQGVIPEKKMFAVTEGNNITYLNITSQIPGGHTLLSITGIIP